MSLAAFSGQAPELPLFARVLPPMLRGSAAAWASMRGVRTLAAASLRTVEGVGRARLDVHGQAPAAALGLRAKALRGVLARLCEVHRVEIDRRGAMPEGPSILVANHLGYLDAMVLGSLAPCAPIAKREVADWPVLGAGASALGVLFVDRGDPFSGMRALREALRCLDAGVSVLCFPEGTTTTGEELLAFRRGIFGVARLAGVPIVPIALRYEDPALCWVGDDDFLPHYLRTAARERSVARVRIGAPIDACASRTPAALASETRDRITALLRSEA